MPSTNENEKDTDHQLDALRTDEEHRHHHARGDVGGKYLDQEDGGDEHIKAGDRARQDAYTEAPEEAGPVLVVVMGVSGCGKSTLGEALAHAFRIPFVDADELHPQSNIDKMSAGTPLTDADRQPWLERVREEAVRTCKEQKQKTTDDSEDTNNAKPGLRGIVVGCSALKHAYRNILRGLSQSLSSTSPLASHANGNSSSSPSSSAPGLPTYFIFIRGTRSELMHRMENRKGHFMKAGMLDSQLATLEPPDETGEPNVVVVDLEKPVEEQIWQARERLGKLGLSL